MIDIKGVSKSFEGKKVLEDVTYTFSAGTTTAVAGPSGKGKTTLINIILGLMKPDCGTVNISANARVSCVFQEDRLIEHMTARQNLLLTSPKGADIDKALIALGLDPENTDRVLKYSGGMRRRVAIARAVLAEPDVLILDEPFKGLDAEIRQSTAEFILDNCGNACRILITHDPDELELMKATEILNI